LKLRHRILLSTGAIVVLAIASFAFALSRNAACPVARSLPAGADLAIAVVRRCYGSYDVLSMEQVAKPARAADEVLVKVHSASVNPLDWHMLTGKPYVMRLSTGFGVPEQVRIGTDFAGTVESVGRDVTRFQPGDEVFGATRGAFAQYVAVRAQASLVRKPAELTFEQAAAIPIAAVTALQGLRDKARLRAGQHVLINGASGGVGTFAVQLAKIWRAKVTGVSSTRNVELVRSIGADQVIDYTHERFIDGDVRYDIVFDTVGNHSLLELRRVLKPGGIVVLVGGSKRDPWLGPLWRSIGAAVLGPFVHEKLVKFYAHMNAEDLDLLAGLARSGKLTPVVDLRFPLVEVPAALEYLAGRHARGKVIVNVEEPT